MPTQSLLDSAQTHTKAGTPNEKMAFGGSRAGEGGIKPNSGVPPVIVDGLCLSVPLGTRGKIIIYCRASEFIVLFAFQFKWRICQFSAENVQNTSTYAWNSSVDRLIYSFGAHLPRKFPWPASSDEEARVHVGRSSN